MNYKEWLEQPFVILAKSRQDLTLTCHVCDKNFVIKKHQLQSKASKGCQELCCSYTCAISCYSAKYNTIEPCGQCGNPTRRSNKEQKKSKSGKVFCSHACSCLYSNAHKTTGTRRSKLEVWLEQQLTVLYPNLPIQFNMKDTIQSELDIYIPSMKLAFELNGVFHYEPIYGADKLLSITNNDTRKFQACLEQRIELCIIDTSKQKRFTEKSSQQFLAIIQNIISQKLLAMSEIRDLNPHELGGSQPC